MFVYNVERMRHKDDSKRVAISNAAIELITTIGFADTSPESADGW
jgi:DNA-binding transcriptional regulator YbjK